MKQTTENFLTSRLPIAGLAGYSLQLPDRTTETESLGKSLYPANTAQMLTRLVQSGRTLLPPGEGAARYCWTYECHRVYVAARADGGCLALLVENNPSAQLLRIQQTLQDFLDLPQPEDNGTASNSSP